MLRGCIALTALLLNTLLWCSVFFVFARVRLALPFTAVRRVLNLVLNAVATTWVACNSAWMRLTQRTVWDVQGIDGLAWWALDFPYMRRHSEAELRAHPEKHEQSIESARRACAKFALVPTSVMNFVEGTLARCAGYADLEAAKPVK